MSKNAALLIAGALLVSSGCHKSSKATNVSLGACLSQTGFHNAPGPGVLLSIQTAVNDINGQGGVLGGQLSVTAEDDQSTAAGSTSCATDLVNNKSVPAIIGSFGGDTMDPALAVTVPASVAYISDLVSLGDLSTTNLNGLVFSTAADHILQGQLLAARAYTAHSLTKCAIIKVDQPSTNSFATGFNNDFSMLGGSILSTQTISTGQSSYTSTLQAIYAAGAVQCIMLATYTPDAIVILKDYLSGFTANNTWWFFPPTLNQPAFQTGVGASNFTFSHEGIDTGAGPGYGQYNTLWMAANPSTTLEQEPGSYDDVYLLAMAIEYAGTASGTEIKNSMRNISNPPGTTLIYPGDWGKAVTAIQAGTKVQYQGATGTDTFDNNGQAEPPYLIWQFKTDGTEPTVCNWNAANTQCM